MCNAICGSQRCNFRQWHNSPHSFEIREGKRVCYTVKNYVEENAEDDAEYEVDLKYRKRPCGRAPNGKNGCPMKWDIHKGWVETQMKEVLHVQAAPSEMLPVQAPSEILPAEDEIDLRYHKRPRGRAPNGKNGFPMKWDIHKGWVETVQAPPEMLPVQAPPEILPVQAPSEILPVQPSVHMDEVFPMHEDVDEYDSEAKREQRTFFASCCAALIDPESLTVNMSYIQSLFRSRTIGNINDEQLIGRIKKICNIEETPLLSNCSISQQEFNDSLQKAREYAKKGRGILYLETEVGWATQELLSYGVPAEFLHPCNRDENICKALKCQYPKTCVEHGYIQEVACGAIWIAIWYDTTSTWSMKKMVPEWNWKQMPYNFRNAAFCMVNLSSRCIDTDLQAEELKNLLECPRMGNGFSCWAHGYKGKGNIRNMVVGGGFYKCEIPFPIHLFMHCSLLIPVSYFSRRNTAAYLVRDGHLRANVIRENNEQVDVIFLDKNGIAFNEVDSWHPSLEELYRFRETRLN